MPSEPPEFRYDKHTVDRCIAAYERGERTTLRQVINELKTQEKMDALVRKAEKYKRQRDVLRKNFFIGMYQIMPASVRDVLNELDREAAYAST